MTKAPFSVEWLSQSSRATNPAWSGTEIKQAASSTFPEGFQPLEGRSFSNTKPAQRALGQSDVSRGQEHRPSLQKHVESSSTVRTSLAAPKPAWSTSECGSDGEGSLSERQTSEDAGGRSTSTRRLRTAFSLEQISTLESSFKRQKYLGAAERRKLANKMQLSEVQIKTWFQNRRMKLKRQLQEMRPDPFHAAQFYSPLPFGPQSGPLSYVYSPHQQTFSRKEAVPSGIAFPPMPPLSLDPMNTSGGQLGALWPMQVPYYVGYQDPRTVFLTL
ncbi:homeobox protein vent1-like [Hemicordylus capensis]|uniref:homeobox protein vent1-like n=1 Tax=Hemicordylus capensis TaxID=884348 RepID=UPI002304C5FF|nr:homeobox protein vent1-like [Hemicordylus capensis]